MDFIGIENGLGKVRDRTMGASRKKRVCLDLWGHTFIGQLNEWAR